jgi:hypothetical protein
VTGKRFLAVLAGLTYLCLASCGGGGSGGGGGGSVGVNHAPTAVAGAAQTAVTGGVVTFDGSASSDPDGTAITFAWTLTSKPAESIAALTGATTAKPSLHVDKDGGYTLSLTVSDGSLSATATTTVTAVSDANDLAAAAAAKLSAIVDMNVSQLRLQWLDSFPAGAGYRVETQATDGSWVTVEAIAGVGGGNSPMLWSRPYSGAATYRVLALASGREIPILSVDGLSALRVSVPTGVQIAIDKAEPVVGVAQLSVSAAPAASTVAWTVDAAAIGSGNPFSWDAATVPDGAHVLIARVALGGDVAVELRRDITTANPNLALSVTSYLTAANTIRIEATATAPGGIASVQASVDGGAVQTLNAPNGCGPAPSCPLGFNRYQFSYNTLTLGSGSHTVSITATDTGGAVRTISYSFSVANGPSLTLSTPLKGFLVGPTLQLTGSTTTDTGQPVTVTASLGTRTIFTSTASSFSGSIVLATVPGDPQFGNPPGFTPGDYTLTVVARDVNGKTATVQRPIVITSGTLPAPTFLFTTDEDATILGVHGDLVLYRTTDNRDHIRNSQTGAVVDLAATGTTTPINMTVSADWAFGVAQGADSICKTTDYCVYRWSTATGAVSVLSNLDPNQPSPAISVYRENLQLRGNFLMWRTIDRFASNPPSKISIYNISTGAFSVYNPSTLGGGSASIGVAEGLPVVANIGLSPSAGLTGCAFGFYCVTTWTAASGEKVAASVNAFAPPSGVRTDGANVAYTTFAGLPSRTGSLFVTPVTGGASTLLDAGFGVPSLIDLENGALVWTVSGRTVSISQSQPILTISTTPCAPSPQRLAAGLFAYCKDNQSYTWNAVGGVSTPKVETIAAPLFITTGWLYFKSGVNVYRVPVS